MLHNHFGPPAFGMQALRKPTQLVLRRFASPPACALKSRAHLSKPLWLSSGILRTHLAKQECVTHLGLGARGEETPLNVVRGSELGHPPETRRGVLDTTIFPIQC